MTAEERELHDIVMQLSREPQLISMLAPNARHVFHSETEIDEPLANSPDALSWIAESELLLIPAGAQVKIEGSEP